MIEDILSQILQKNLKISPKGFTLTKLQGDASYRIYYRLQVEDGRSFIVMQLPAGKSSASEEITHLKEKPQELPFINIAKDLKKKGLPVPEIFHDEKEAGIILLEDFGDETLEKKLQKGSAAEQDHWYQKAIDLLILFQEKCRQKNADCVAYQRSFDTTLLQWEFDHFIEYGIEARTGLKINEDDLKEIRRWTNFITFALAQLPQILVHRDFQSRNIMIYNDSLKLLDFQDALLGP
ncbi:MAG: phosphotransferase, partial [Deltaproteobacteria bacterium]|nr:phosphotransferase [Deltaproteobacteria bacterium]